MKPETNIEEYFAKREGNKDVLISKELFKANEDVDIKTDLSIQEIVLINSLMWNNDFLDMRGCSRIYDKFLNNWMRLKISLDRKSRGEFVDMNKGDHTDDVLSGMSNLSNISGAKK